MIALCRWPFASWRILIRIIQLFVALCVSRFLHALAGCFFWTIVHHATDADWSWWFGASWKHCGVAGGVAILFIRFFPSTPSVFLDGYPPGVEHSLDAKRAYLNWYFFLGRPLLCSLGFSFASTRFASLIGETGQGRNPRFTI